MATKILWTVHVPDLHSFQNRAEEVGASAVAVRTDFDNFHDAIPAFHDAGIRILGWRFPSTVRDRALAQAQHVVDLMELGLDGFIADPESDPNPHLNWDQSGLEDLAREFCETIRSRFPAKLFGTTSHFRARRVFPNLPFGVFISNSDEVYPQAYWRVQTDHGPRPVSGGKPAPNYAEALDAWREAGADPGTIVPMAGEIAVVTREEIAAYGAAAATHGIEQLHFYTADDPVPDAVWQAIAALCRGSYGAVMHEE